MNNRETANDFYVAAYEVGAENTPVATWASQKENPLALDEAFNKTVQRAEVQNVPGAFQLLDLLSRGECEEFIKATEALGYTQDASVSLPRNVRRNENLVWVIDETTHDIIWDRCKAFMQHHTDIYNSKKPLGLNKRFRFYRYSEGDFFKPHTDGAWPGSRITNKKLIANAYPDRYSQMTFLILLSEAFTGGETAFYVDKNDPNKPARRTEDVKIVEIKTPVGGVLCFPHGSHTLHCLHGSREILSGVKYIIRTDVLFEI